MEIQGGICTLCLKKYECFKTIDGTTKNILDMLLLKIDFTDIQGRVTCKNCEGMLTKCFDFKTACLHTHNHIVPFLNNKDDVKLNLEDVYLSKNATATDVAEDQNICAFCMGLIKNCFAVPLDVEETDVTLKKMIEQCLPELDLSRIDKPVICAYCHESLKNCFHFVMNCLTVGEKIKKCRETPNINSKGQIELSCSLQHTTTDVTTKKIFINSADTIKLEQFSEATENPHETGDGSYTAKLEQIFFDVSKDVKIKNTNFMEINDHEVDNEQQFTPKNILSRAGESNKFDFIKREEIFYEENDESERKDESLAEMEDQIVLLKEEAEIKTEECEFNRFEDGIIFPQSEFNSRLLRREKCSPPTLERDQLDPYPYIEHRTKKHVPKIRMYSCEYCSYRARQICHLKNHLLTHKEPSEVTMYKCDSCSFETRHKRNLINHFLTHKDPVEVTMYKCDSCSFQTKIKSILNRHLLVHKVPAEVTMYNCDSCAFQTRHKNSLKEHLLRHKDPSEVTMYKCDSCSFQTKYKSGLRNHLLTHKYPAEVTMYNCDSCAFQTRHKKNLKDHLLKHKDPSEVIMYKCYTCAFQTRRKNSLKDHLLKHKDASEVTMYKCDTCTFQTRRKNSLKPHLLKHKDASEVTMYKCDSCSFQTKYKHGLKNHLLTHKHTSEVTMYNCDQIER